MILENTVFLDGNFEFNTGDIIVEGEAIKEIIPRKNVKPKKIILPAFISTHSHFGETIFRGVFDWVDLERYIELTSGINEKNEHLREEIRKASCELSILEFVKNGISTVQSARTWSYVKKSPLKGDLGYPLMKSRKLAGFYDNFESDFETISDKFHSDRIKVCLWAHSLPYVDEAVLEKAGDLFTRKKLFLTIHLDETKNTVEQTMKKYGEGGVSVLERYGLLNSRTNLVHCVHTTKKELDIIKDKKANITLCPTTNLKLSSGLPDFQYILSSKINYSLANDTLAANNSANFYELMKITGLIFSKLKISEKELFKSVTLNPATTLGRLKQGAIKEGQKADMQVIESFDTRLYPKSNLLSNLIYSRTAIPSSVILDGKYVVKNGEILFSSEEEACRKIQEVFEKLSK